MRHGHRCAQWTDPSRAWASPAPETTGGRGREDIKSAALSGERRYGTGANSSRCRWSTCHRTGRAVVASDSVSLRPRDAVAIRSEPVRDPPRRALAPTVERAAASGSRSLLRARVTYPSRDWSVDAPLPLQSVDAPPPPTVTPPARKLRSHPPTPDLPRMVVDRRFIYRSSGFRLTPDRRRSAVSARNAGL